MTPPIRTAILALLLLIASGCSGDDSSDEAAPVATGPVAVAALSAGDCFTSETPADAVVISDVVAVGCEEPHHGEVYAQFRLADGDYPGAARVAATVSAGCEERFAGFVGVDYADSRLVIGTFSPTEASWDDSDDRLVSCFVFLTAESSLGSAEGTEQ